MTELDKILFKKKLKEWRISFIYGAIVLSACVILYFIFFYHAHSYSEWEIFVKPSCIKNGAERRYCSCGEYEQRPLEKISHIEGEWIVNEEKSERQLLCTVCSAVLDFEAYTSHTHIWSEWQTVNEASCWQAGLMQRSCECGESESKELTVLTHTEGDWILEGIVKSYPCICCGTIMRTEELEASKGLLIEDGVLISIGTCTDTEIILPKEVTEIGKKAFQFNEDIESIYFHKGVKEIGEKAFYSCTSLKRLVFEAGMLKIGEQAFANCSSLEDVTLPSGLEALGSRAFSYCEKLKAVHLPASVYLDMWCFSYCERLSAIYYDGTKEEWESLRKDSKWNMYTNDYTIYCTDGNIEK